MKNKDLCLYGAALFGMVLLTASCEKMNLSGRSNNADGYQKTGRAAL